MKILNKYRTILMIMVMISPMWAYSSNLIVDNSNKDLLLEDPISSEINIKADQLFDFDSAVLRPQYHKELMEFAQFCKQIQVEKLIVVGHTDQSGTDAYNQKLSEKRARAVATYLINEGGLPVNIMHIAGMGEREPVKDCGNPDRPSPVVKACNEANRRVEVFLTGNPVKDKTRK